MTPRGSSVFDHMSQKEGHASSTSFFATHPAYGDRIQSALKEYKALRGADNPHRTHVTDTSEFQEMKERLRKSLQKTEQEVQEELNKPSLNRSEPPPGKMRGNLEGHSQRCPRLYAGPRAHQGARKIKTAQQRTGDLEAARSLPASVDEALLTCVLYAKARQTPCARPSKLVDLAGKVS